MSHCSPRWTIHYSPKLIDLPLVNSIIAIVSSLRSTIYIYMYIYNIYIYIYIYAHGFYMITPWYRNALHITSPVWGSTSNNVPTQRLITPPSDVILYLAWTRCWAHNQMLVIWGIMALMWLHCNSYAVLKWTYHKFLWIQMTAFLLFVRRTIAMELSKTNHSITTTKHNKVRAECIVLGIWRFAFRFPFDDWCGVISIFEINVINDRLQLTDASKDMCTQH